MLSNLIATGTRGIKYPRNYMICSFSDPIYYLDGNATPQTDFSSRASQIWQYSKIDCDYQATVSASISANLSPETLHMVGQLTVVFLVCMACVIVASGFYLGSYIYKK
jgi:hypothetical protein